MVARTRRLYLAVMAVFGLSVSAGIGLTGCTGTWTALPTAEEIFAMGAAQGEDDYRAMRRGRALVVTECTDCHRFFWPHEYPSEMWPSLMQGMGRKSVLTRRQIEDTTRYMVTASRLTRGDSGPSILQVAFEEQFDPEEVRRGRALAMAECRGCHRFRRPHEFPAGVWPGIVQSHMDGRSSLTDEEMLAIARYYVHESRGKADVGVDH